MNRYRDKYKKILKKEKEIESVKHLIKRIHKDNNLLRLFLSDMITVEEFERWVTK